MAVPIPLLKFSARRNNGQALAAGKLYAFASGTATPKATYTTSTGNIQNSHPIILDSRGEADVYLGEGQYSFWLFDSNDNLQYTVNGITGDGSSSQKIGFALNYDAVRALSTTASYSVVYCAGRSLPNDGGEGTFLFNPSSTSTDDGGIVLTPSNAPATGRWVRQFQGSVNVKWYGATGGGVLDDSASFTLANNYASNLTNGGSVLVPNTSEEYRIDQNLEFASNVVLQIEPGAFLYVPSNVSATFPGGIESDPQNPQRIFNGPGKIILGNDFIYPEWWGMSESDSGPINTSAIQYAAHCATDSSSHISTKTLCINPGNYYTTATVTVPSEWVDVDMQGTIIARNFNGAAISIDVGGDGVDYPRIYGRTYVFSVERETLDWSVGPGIRFDSGSWVVNNCGVKLVNLNQCSVTIKKSQQFDVGVDIYGQGGSFAFNNITAYSCRRNQIGVRVSTPTYFGNIGFYNDNLWTGGDFRVDGGIPELNNVSRYWLAVDDAQDFDNNIFLKVGCELNTVNYSMTTGEGVCIYMEGFCFGNEFLQIRGESADGFARIEPGTWGSTKQPQFNKFTAGAGFEESFTWLEDNTDFKINFVQNFRSAGEIASRFNVLIHSSPNLYEHVVTYTSAANLGDNVAGVDGYFVANATSTPSFPGRGNHITNLTGVQGVSATRSVYLQSDRAVGTTIDGIVNEEEFQILVKCVSGDTCRVAFRPYDDSGALVSADGSLLGEPSRIISYSSGVLAWRHGSDENDPTIRVKVNNPSIVAMDVLVFGGIGGSKIKSFEILSTEYHGHRHGFRGVVSYSALQPGRIPFTSSPNGFLDQGSVYYDAVNERVGIGSGASSPGAMLDVVRSTSGTNNVVRIYNSHSSDGNSGSELQILTNTANGGDPKIRWNVNGVTTWVMGIDNSDSDALVISESSTLGTSNRLRLTPGGGLTIYGNNVNITTANTPATSAASGTTGTVCWDSNYLYVCTATNAWKRVAIAAW